MLQVVAMPRKIFASMYLFSFLSYSVRYFKREHDSGTFFKQPIPYLVTNQGSNARKLHTPKSIDIDDIACEQIFFQKNRKFLGMCHNCGPANLSSLW